MSRHELDKKRAECWGAGTTLVLFAYHLTAFVRIRAGNRPEVIK